MAQGNESLDMVGSLVDDDLFSCFLWAAGEDALKHGGDPITDAARAQAALQAAKKRQAEARADPGPANKRPMHAPMTSTAGRPTPPATTIGPAASSVPLPSQASASSTSQLHSQLLQQPGCDDLDDDDDDEGFDDGQGEKTGGKTDEFKIQKRLSRKAESARLARLRKKQYVNDLENKVNMLMGRIKELEESQQQQAKLHLQQQLTPAAADTKDGEQNGKGTPGKDANVGALVETFVDNKRRRQQLIEEHLDEVEELLAPGSQVKFAFWGLDQDDSFYQKPGLGSQMLEILGKEIGLTQEQMQRLQNHRKSIRLDRETWQRSHRLIKELRTNIAVHVNNSANIMDNLRGVLTPVQVAKFFVWVEKHQQSIQMLNTLWDPTSNYDQQAGGPNIQSILNGGDGGTAGAVPGLVPGSGSVGLPLMPTPAVPTPSAAPMPSMGAPAAHGSTWMPASMPR